jgi:hypothetical protein
MSLSWYADESLNDIAVVLKTRRNMAKHKHGFRSNMDTPCIQNETDSSAWNELEVTTYTFVY